MSTIRRTAAVIVTAIALALALGQLGPGVEAVGSSSGTPRLDAVSRLHDAMPVARLRAADGRLTHHRPALAAVAGVVVAALALLLLGAAEPVAPVPTGNVLRRHAAGRGPPR